MKSVEDEGRMLEETLETFRGASEAVIAPQDGISLIDGWLEVLQHNVDVDGVRNQLEELRGVLQEPTPDADRVRTLLISLSDQSMELAGAPYAAGTWTGKLAGISNALRNFSSQL